MKTYKITVEYEDTTDQVDRKKIWQIHQQALNYNIPYLRATVVKVTEVKEATNENDQAKKN